MCTLLQVQSWWHGWVFAIPPRSSMKSMRFSTTMHLSFASTANISGTDLAYVLQFPTYRAYANDSAMVYEGLAYCSFVLPPEILNITQFNSWLQTKKHHLCESYQPSVCLHLPLLHFFLWHLEWRPEFQEQIMGASRLFHTHTDVDLLWSSVERKLYSLKNIKQKETLTSRWRSLHQHISTCSKGLVTHTPTQMPVE